ncbi:MAG: hypothetical protein M1816_003524 [Peltula sp. TS41687]|nr:MAG: hypothetical protein M1816_003524 [Peltula sp. TS41687]
MPTKSAGAPSYSMGYGDEAHESYTAVSPQFMLPSQDSMGNPTNYGPQDPLRAWNSPGQNGKASNGVFIENELPQYPNSHLPLLNQMGSRMPVVSGDGSTFFPGLGSLSSSLPGASSTADRILPKPHHHNVSGSSTHNGNEPVPPPSYNWDGLKWGSESRPVVGSEDYRRVSSASNAMPLGASGSKNLLTSQESSYGYVPMLNGSGPQEPSASSSAYSTTTYSASSTPYSGFASPDAGSLPSMTSPGDTSMGGQGSSSDLYSYSTGSTFNKGPQGTRSGANEGTLVSGQPYTRLNQTHSTPVNPLTSLRRNSQESRSQQSHRTSISGFKA